MIKHHTRYIGIVSELYYRIVQKKRSGVLAEDLEMIALLSSPKSMRADTWATCGMHRRVI